MTRREQKTAEREWRNASRRPVPRCKPARRAPEPSIFKYIVPVIRATVRALWRYVNHR